jgi:hypothetical protein
MGNRTVNLLAGGLLCSALGACVFDRNVESPSTLVAADDFSPVRTFFIGGSVQGVTGVVTLLNSNGRTLTLVRDGAFAFETQMVSSAVYNVTVAVHPDSAICVVAHGAGTVNGADIRNVTVSCAPKTYLAAKR